MSPDTGITIVVNCDSRVPAEQPRRHHNQSSLAERTAGNSLPRVAAVVRHVM